MLCISYIPIDSIITYLHSLCPKFLIGSKPKRHNTSGVGLVGEKTNSQVPTEHGEISTVLTFINAAGNILPPLIIHEGRRVNGTWLDGIPKDVMVKASPKGYINKGIF